MPMLWMETFWLKRLGTRITCTGMNILTCGGKRNWISGTQSGSMLLIYIQAENLDQVVP